MILNTEQLAILAHVVTDPQAWADHAEATLGEEVVLAKIEKYRPDWEAQKDLPGYKTKAERDIPPPPPPRDIKAEIAAIEAATLTPRGTREFMLMYFEATFTAEQLAANPGYQKAKAVDNQIKALRSLL